MSAAPHRACRLTLVLEADTLHELASALLNFAYRVEADQMTTGVHGGPSSGAIYELHCDAHPSHDEYFKQVRDYLESKKP